MSSNPPEFPVGAFRCIRENGSSISYDGFIEKIAVLPGKLSDVVSALSEDELDTKYRNWSIRQIVHHICDSHLHSYVRFKWALTEDEPTIKAYDEAAWSDLEEARRGDCQPSLMLLEGLHQRWVRTLRCMQENDYLRLFKHPESGEWIQLGDAVQYYAWHGTHHCGQIAWLRDKKL